MRITVTATGTSPYCPHSDRTADPMDPVSQEIAAITAKKKGMTDLDRDQVDRMKYLASFYTNSHGLVIPTKNVMRCIVEAGIPDRMGKAIQQSLTPLGIEIPLVHDGPKTPEDLWKSPEYRWRTNVKVGRGRVPTVRPIFRKWGFVFEADFNEQGGIRNFETLKAYIESAGVIIGLGDARRLGYGRFSCEVTNGAVPAKRH